MYQTIKCESKFNPKAKGDYENGEPTSLGLVQIHLPAHPEITKKQAENPEFALNFMASEFSKGKQWEWSCHTKLFRA